MKTLLERLLIVGLLLGTAGCGPTRPPVAPVYGTVTQRGKPIDRGTIMFVPSAGRPATAAIDANGHYALTTFRNGDGAVLGEHRVVIEALVPPASHATPSVPIDALDFVKGESAFTAPSTAASDTTWIVPKRYAAVATTPLTATVKPGDNVIDFTLP